MGSTRAGLLAYSEYSFISEDMGISLIRQTGL